MAKELHYIRSDYTATVSQTTTVTLAGETSGAHLNANMEIAVYCTNLGSFLTWTGAYISSLNDGTPTKTYPTVTLDTPAMAAAASTLDGDFRDITKDTLTDDLNNTVETLQGIFKTATWAYSSQAFGSADYPIEAVLQVQNGSLTAPTLAVVVGSSADVGTVQGAYPVDLFEQCLAAGKISLGTLNDANGIGSPTFAANDSISLYVTYTLTKTREFVVDQSISSGTPSITVGSTTISASGSATEVSAPINRVVRWKFTQQ